MESPNAPPAHDFFTPAWLKLPDPQVSKKSISSVSPLSQSGLETQHKKYSISYNNHRKDLNNSTNSISNCESRERFNTNFHDSSQPYLSSRHNSFGSEQQLNKPNAQTVGNNVNGFRGKKYIDSSQRPNYRSNYREKGSIAHHSNTKPNRNSDAFKPNFNSSTKKSFNKSFDYCLDNDSTEKSAPNEENCNVFNQEFPSLVNDTNSPQNGGPNDNSSFHSAWNNATKSKVLSTSKNFQLIHSSVANFDNIESANKSDTTSIANASKQVISSPVYRNISLIGKAKGGVGGIMKENGVYSKIQPMLTKTSTQTTPAMEILVKNPKKRSNKSDFLNSIRNNENKDKESNDFTENFEKIDISSESRNNYKTSELQTKLGQNNQMSYENDLKNTQNINNKYIRRQQPDEYEEDMGVLSSSLEAEHRLLMELGWKAEQDDDPSYAPLTDDEVREFLVRRNVFKRNTTTNTTTSNQTIHLSPKKSNGLDAENHSSDEDSSSSDDD